MGAAVEWRRGEWSAKVVVRLRWVDCMTRDAVACVSKGGVGVAAHSGECGACLGGEEGRRRSGGADGLGGTRCVLKNQGV